VSEVIRKQKSMEWQISPLAKASSWNDKPFQDGDEITTLLLVTQEEGIRRYDIHRSDMEMARAALKGKELGRWNRVFKSAEDLRQARQQRIQSAEDLFFSLFELEKANSADNEMVPEVRAKLKHILALHLERRRILRPLGPRKKEGEQIYCHAKTGREIPVPVVPVDDRLVRHLTSTLSDLIL